MHLPLLRFGTLYRSLDSEGLANVTSGQAVATVSQANPGLIARDLGRLLPAGRQALQRLSVAELLAICRRAADLFMDEELPVGESVQSADDYVHSLSETTGMPHALCRANMDKIRFVLAEMETVLGGLTRGVDLGVLDSGWGVHDGRPVSYRAETDSLGVILPSNSPGVHSLWIPSIALKVPVVLKPGSREPWTPYRVIQALIAAGCPAEAFGFYPTSHAGATEILMRTGRSMLFGDKSTVAAWSGDPRVQIHGPGWSKVLLGEDVLGDWQAQLDLVVTSVAANGGRSCINASGLWLAESAADSPAVSGREVAMALAERLATIEALPLDHEAAGLAAFSDPEMARRISEYIDQELEAPGAEDLSAAVRGERLVEVEGLTYLLPTVIWCEDPTHPLATTELLFPFVSVVQVPQGEMLSQIGSSLVVSALTEDPAFVRDLLDCRSIERLNLGRLPTSRVDWDQPHEGNLFEHLYRQRALQGLELAATAG